MPLSYCPSQRLLAHKVKFSPKELVGPKTAAQMRGVTKQAIDGMIRRGRLKTVVIDGHTFLLKKDIENYQPSVGGRPKSKGEPAKKRAGSRKSSKKTR